MVGEGKYSGWSSWRGDEYELGVGGSPSEAKRTSFVSFFF